MFALNGENRNTSLKPKQLRRQGIIPAILYGKGLEESLSLQFSQGEVARFLRSNSRGSTVQLQIGDKKYPALFREVTYEVAADKPEHLSFQMLMAEEVIASAARIVLLGQAKDNGMVQQQLNEVAFRALPAHLIDRIDIDLEGMEIGTTFRVSDLDITKNPDIEVLSPLDDLIFSVSDASQPMEAEADDEAAESETTAEPELVTE